MCVSLRILKSLSNKKNKDGTFSLSHLLRIALSLRPSAKHLILFILSINKSESYFSKIDLYNQWLHCSGTKSNIIENQIFVWHPHQDYMYVYHVHVYHVHIAQYDHSPIVFHCVKIPQWLSSNFISKVQIKGRPLITFKF